MALNLPEIGLPNIFDLLTPEKILNDYRIAYRSRQISLLGRQEVLSGRAKFGIFGDGKEVPQVALAHFFNKGDFRSGYYRDQTLMMALGEVTVRTFFAQLYSHNDLEAEPASGGRMMNAHFVTRSLNPDGSWRNLTDQYNSAADISPTASQMPRLVGLAQASQIYRHVDALKHLPEFSNNGNEVAFGIIGNASTSEGMFWEAVNAIGVLGAPAVISIWDDGYGISVPNEYQMTKSDLSALFSGFQRKDGGAGYDVYAVDGWDYVSVVLTYAQAVRMARENHVPALVHVKNLTQPQGHSTSGSHERYKSEERLAWEKEHDCLKQMRDWILAEGVANAETLDALETEERDHVRAEQRAAWKAFVESVDIDRQEVKGIIEEVASYSAHRERIQSLLAGMLNPRYPKRRDIFETIFAILLLTREENIPARDDLIEWRDERLATYQDLYSTNLHSETNNSPLLVPENRPVYQQDAPLLNGFEVLNTFFDAMFDRDPRVVTMGEDTGFLGGVNQSMAGMQAKYGKLRVADTGIRETTIVGQAIGLALRGLRPIAEIQYLDYALYALQIMSDDAATLRWRTVGQQKAPVIIRTRGHRLEGIWHSGSLMAGILHLVRGMHVLVPRDMTHAVGFYNTLLLGDDPALVVEPLNGYRKKERLPENLADVTVPLGVPETLREGKDITLVTYGATCFVALDAVVMLDEVGIDVEVIDAQSLLPFDRHGAIVKSLQKTNRLLVVDEDVPGGSSAFILQQVLEAQGGYTWLDSQPRTLTGKAHRPAYGTDGDYFSKPNKENIFEVIYDMMNEANPAQYPYFTK